MASCEIKPLKHHRPDHTTPKRIPKHPDKEHIKRRHEKYVQAMVDRDVDAQMKFYSPDAVVVDMSKSCGLACASAGTTQRCEKLATRG